MQHIKLGVKPHTKTIINCIMILTMLFSILWLVNPGMARAEGTSSTLSIKLNDNGNISTVATYTFDQLQEMPQVREAYTTIDNMPAPKFVAAEGIMLRDLLEAVNIDIDTVDSFKLTATDDYSKTLSKEYLLDTPRYYYPNIKIAFDTDNYPLFNDGAEDNRSLVEPILALQSHQERFNDEPQYELMDGTDAIKLCFGQETVSELTSNKFIKWIKEIEVSGELSDTEAPVDNPDGVSLVLSSSTAITGDSITASGTADADTWVSIKVLDDSEEANIVVFDAVKSDADGAYSYTFKVPFLSSGILTVVAGYGSNVATETLDVSLEKTEIATNKVWTIEFSKAVDPTSLNDSIYVARDANGNDKVTDIAVNPDSSDPTQVTVGPPAGESWEAGETYYLFITTAVESTGGNSLDSPISMKFITASQ